MIFAYHYFPYKSQLFPQWTKHLFIEFRMGIDLFFVLSGFLITYRYFDQNPINFRNYIVNRFARIYPVHILLTVLTYILIYLSKGWDWNRTIEFLLNITLTKALFKDYIFTGIQQGWTLTMEELFYFTAPLFFIIIRKNYRFLILIPLFIFFAYYGVKQISIQQNLWGGFMQINIAKYIFDFFIGIALALIMKRNNLQKFRNFNFTWFGIFMIAFYIIVRSIIREQLDTSNDFVRASELTFLSLTGIAPLIWGLIKEKTIISTFLANPLFILLGKSSYVFYLIHWSFVSEIIQAKITHHIPLLFILLNIISVIIYMHFEKPFNIFVKKIFHSKN